MVASVQGQTPETRPSQPASPAQLEYRNVPFSGARIDCEDPRFHVAAFGFEFVGGVRLTSRDPALYSIDWYEGSRLSGLLRDGRAIVFRLADPARGEETQIRLTQTAELAGGAIPPGSREEAPDHPEIPGYRFIMSDKAPDTDEYLGLWRRLRGSAETLIVRFRPAGGSRSIYTIIGRMPLPLASISVHTPQAQVMWEVDLASQASVGRPFYIMRYEWYRGVFQALSGTPQDDDARTTCRMAGTRQPRPILGSPWLQFPLRPEFRRIAFTAQRVEREDPRFRMAPEGYRLMRGVRLTSRDPALYSVAWINGLSAGMLRDGRGFTILPHAFHSEGPTEMRVGRTIEAVGGYRDRSDEANPAPASYPHIPGYRFVISDRTISPEYVGLWHRLRGPDETLIVIFRSASSGSPARHQIIGRLPLRLKGIYLYDGLHMWRANLISEAAVGQPLYILNYSLVPASNPVTPQPDSRGSSR